MKDLESLENLLSKLERKIEIKDKKVLKKLDFLKKIKEAISQGNLISEIDLSQEEELKLREFQFLTAKPLLYILNTNGEPLPPSSNNIKFLAMNLKFEQEFSELPESETKDLGFKSHLDQLILSCYNILDLITFYTIAGGKEVRAWEIKRGSKAPEAGGKVHSDFKKNFIKAEVLPWEKLIESGSWQKAKEKGLIKTRGKDYIVEDGDIIEFKI